jgi:hypothetical protein
MVKSCVSSFQQGSVDFYEYATLHKFLGLMQQAFFAGDRDRTGFLDCQEIFTALGVGQLIVSLPSVQALFQAYSKVLIVVELFFCVHFSC